MLFEAFWNSISFHGLFIWYWHKASPSSWIFVGLFIIDWSTRIKLNFADYTFTDSLSTDLFFINIVSNIIHWQTERKYAHSLFKLPRETPKHYIKVKQSISTIWIFPLNLFFSNNKKFIFSLKQFLYIHAICYQQKQQSKVQLPLPHPHPHLIS